MTWSQIYDPLGSIWLSTLLAALPVLVLLGAIGIFEIKAHIAAALGLLSALVVAILGFGMPAGESSEKMLEVAVGRMFRDSPEVRLRSLAAQPGSRLDVSLLWALIQIWRHQKIFGRTLLSSIAGRLRIPVEVIEPTFDRLVTRGYARRAGDQLQLTADGLRQVNAVTAVIVDRLTHKLARSPSFAGQPDRDQVQAALLRIAGRMLIQRDWFDDHGLTDATTPLRSAP